MTEVMVYSPWNWSAQSTWLALAVDVAVKGMLVIAVAALVSALLRGSSAAVRHFVWTIAAAALLALPALSLLVPRWRLPLPGVPAGWNSEHVYVFSGPYGGVLAKPRPPRLLRPIRPPHPPHPSHAPRPPRAGVVVVPSGPERRAVWLQPGSSAVQVVIPAPRAEAAPLPAPAPSASAAPEAMPDARPRRRSRDSWLDEAGVLFGALRGGRFLSRSVNDGRGPGAGGVLLAVWLLGAFVVFAGIIAGAWGIRRVARASSPVHGGWRVALLRRTCAELGITRRVKLLEGDMHAMPMTWGVLRPVVLVPSTSEAWPSARFQAVLRHELAHVRRADALTQLIAELACVVHWFNPLVWLVARRLRTEREMACDDEVLASGSQPSEYAEQLVLLARALRPVPVAFAAVAMARPTQLRGRVQALLDDRRARGSLPWWLAAPGWVLAGVLLVLLSGLTPVAPAAPAEAVVARAGHFFDFDAPAPAAVSASSAVIARARRPQPAFGVVTAGIHISQRPCWENATSRQTSMSRRDDDMRYVWSARGGCEIEIRTRGEVTFTPDFTDVAGLGRGGSMRVTEVNGSMRRQLEIRPGAGGLEYEWSVDNDARPYDAPAQAWLRSILLQFFRSTGYAAAERSAYILRERGVDGLLQEITHLSGDYARRQYYQAALETGRLTGPQVALLLERAGEEISSDHELTQVLMTAAAKYPLEAELRSSYLRATRTIESDHEKRRALSAVLDRSALTADEVALLLEATATIQSDHEAATLLVAVADSEVSSAVTQLAYVRAAAHIDSDYEQRRTLHRLLEQQRLAPDALLLMLQTARSIQSDYELAELLLQVARTQTLTPELRTEYVRTLDTIESSHEHGRVASALLRAERSTR